MAGDWIKVEYCTPEKTEITAIMRYCDCTRGEAFLAWFRLWRHFDAHCSDGFVRKMSASDADEFGNLNGLSSALEAEGWLTFSGDGCYITNWNRHNGNSAKRRVLDASRKKSLRSNDVSKMSASHADICPPWKRKINGQMSASSADQRREEKSKRIEDSSP